jgi:hypothetical protein
MNKSSNVITYSPFFNKMQSGSGQNGQGIGKFFKKVNKLVSGVGSVVGNTKKQISDLAQSGNGIGQLTNKIISLQKKVNDNAKKLSKAQKGGKRKTKK